VNYFYMSNDTKNSIAWWIDTVWKLSVPLGIIAVFYLKATFATGEDLRALSDRITKSETAILLLTEKQKDDIRQDDLIKDHEIRLRNLERVVR
jgi:hypothetical protein